MKINVITVATPTVNAEGNLENPATHTGILNSHIHIYNEVDGVQVTMANTVDRETYERTYDHDGTQNVMLPTDEVRNMYSKIVTTQGSVKQGIPSYEKEVINKTGAHSFDRKL